MPPVRIGPFDERDRVAVVALWRAADLVRPWNDPDRDIDRKLAVDDGMFFVARVEGSVVGTVMAGYDGHRGWVNYLAVDDQLRDAGLGRRLMEHAEHALCAVGCAKINLQIRASNRAVERFYRHLGYREDDVISMGKRLVDDD
ncbi:MAG: GNAT family acetyltransferase [Actinomycetota bacterium]